jgi:3-oxoacyl-[acyl-carrier-protein] synthase III
MSVSATRSVSILGTGFAVPGKVLEAAALDEQLGLSPGDSERVTGIRQRHVTVGETASQLAAQACHAALKAAGVSWEEVDCLVCASATMDQALPYNAAMLHAELGVHPKRITTLDVGASCLSFLQALDLTSFALEAGRFDTVLIASADISTFTTDLHSLRDNGIFGDGAAAAVLRRTPTGASSRILASRSMTLPEGVDLCQIRSGGSRWHRRGFPGHSEALFEMKGRQLFALVGRQLPAFVDDLLAEAGVDQKDIALLIPHQASRQALDHVAKMLGFDDGRMVDVFGEFGNQVGASLPTALHFAIQRHGLQRGQKALLLGSGAGVSVGGIVFEY